MPSSTPFRLNRTGLLLALISTAFAGQAQAAAGRVEFAIGPATVVGVDGRSRPAARGTELDSGDVVRTNDGRVQMRMTDGAFISLQPNTEFGIKEYRFAGKADGSENAFYSLVKGAMRTVTGLIGRVNRNRYQVATPTATVGIRGTGGLIEILQGGATLVQGTSGIWFLANPAGTIDIPAGVAGLAPVDPKQPPKETVQIPTAGPSPLPALIEFVQGEEREEDGKNVLTAGVLLSGDGYAARLALGFFDLSEALVPDLVSGTGTAIFNGGGQLTQIAFTGGRSGAVYTLESGGTHADFGTDGILAWGRWIGTVTVPGSLLGTEIYSSNTGLHYVIGLPTPTLPTSGPATYTLLGATLPTYIDGSTAPGTFSGSLSVNFGATTASIDANFTMEMPDRTYGMIVKGASTSTAFFSALASGSAMTGCLSSTCSGSVQGFFAGPTAERAGVGYRIADLDVNATFPIPKEIVGAAAFAKQ